MLSFFYRSYKSFITNILTLYKDNKKRVFLIIIPCLVVLIIALFIFSLSQYSFNLPNWYQGTLVQLGIVKPKIATLKAYKSVNSKEEVSSFLFGEEAILAVNFVDLKEFKTLNVKLVKNAKEEVDFMNLEVSVQGTGERFVALPRTLTSGKYTAKIVDKDAVIDTLSFEIKEK